MTLQTYENFPVDTPRHFNVYKMSIRRCQRRMDVLQTLKQRCVSTEFLEYLLQLVITCLPISIIVLLMQLWVLHFIVTYTNNTFPDFFSAINDFRIIVQIQSRQISLGQILCGVKKQILMLFNGKVKHFSYLARVRFRLKGNNKPNSVSKRDIQCGSQPVIPRSTYKK